MEMFKKVALGTFYTVTTIASLVTIGKALRKAPQATTQQLPESTKAAA